MADPIPAGCACPEDVTPARCPPARLQRLVPALPACYLTVLGADLFSAAAAAQSLLRRGRCAAAGMVQGAPQPPLLVGGDGDGCGTWLCRPSVCLFVQGLFWLWLDPGLAKAQEVASPSSIMVAPESRWGQRHVFPSPRPSCRPGVEGRAGRGADQLERIRIQQLR